MFNYYYMSIYGTDVSYSKYIIYSFINSRLVYNCCNKAHEKKLLRNFVIVPVKDSFTYNYIHSERVLRNRLG
jgi:hypothetical protein